jgi:hypothetical protein
MLFDRVPLLLSRSPDSAGGAGSARPTAKVLAASVLRNQPAAELKVVRTLARAEDWKPLFRVERAGLEERGSGAESNGGPWDAVRCVEEVEHYPWVFFLESGSLLLRGVDHLLTGDSDILWAPMAGVPVTAERCGGLLRPEEREPGYRVERPISHPWRQAASAAVWAVRGEHIKAVMEEWEKLFLGSPEGYTPTVEAAWNRLLMDTPLRVARFEKDEVQFPCLPGADFLRWKDAAILNVSDWPPEAQSKFLQAWFYGTYFADPTGLFLDIVEP